MSSTTMRELLDLFEGINYSNGVYCSATPTKQTTSSLREFCEEYGIPNPVPENEMHTTLIYSTKGSDDFECKSEYVSDVKAKFVGFDMFGTNKDTLVIKMKSPELTRRHNEMMDEYDLSYDFDTFIPHITLSYDAVDFDISKLQDYAGDLVFSGEESNDLEKDWEPTQD